MPTYHLLFQHPVAACASQEMIEQEEALAAAAAAEEPASTQPDPLELPLAHLAKFESPSRRRMRTVTGVLPDSPARRHTEAVSSSIGKKAILKTGSRTLPFPRVVSSGAVPHGTNVFVLQACVCLACAYCGDAQWLSITCFPFCMVSDHTHMTPHNVATGKDIV